MNKIKKHISVVLASLMLMTSLLTAFAAVDAWSIELTSSTKNMSVGETFTFVAETGSNTPITWDVTSSSAGIVTYTNGANGQLHVRADAPGTITVTAATVLTSSTTPITAKETVVIANESFGISDFASKIEVGKEYTFKMRGAASATSGATWSVSGSSDLYTATLNSDKTYTIKALKAGKVRVYLYSTSGSTYDYRDVEFVSTAPADTKIVAENTKTTMSVDETYTFTAYKYPTMTSAGVAMEATATPANAIKVTYSGNGQIRITAVAQGTLQITAKADGLPDLVQIVSIGAKSTAVTGISLPASASIEVDERYVIIPAITPSTASNKSVTYTSSNTRVATVDSSGAVRGISAGTATITAKTQDGNFTATTRITVTDKEVVDVGTSPQGLLQDLKNSAVLKLNTETINFNSGISGSVLIAKALKVAQTRVNEITFDKEILESLNEAGLTAMKYELPWVWVYAYPRMAGTSSTFKMSVQKTTLTGASKTTWNSAKYTALSGPWNIKTSTSTSGLLLRFKLPANTPKANMRIIRWNGTRWVTYAESSFSVVKSGTNYYLSCGLLPQGIYAVVKK